jgi:hypothetical protein
MRVLVACEYSGTVRDAFRKLGHDAMSCDLLPTDVPGPHYQGSVLDILNDGWDLMIAHPPCTYLCSSGLHWNKRRPERAEKTQAAAEFVVKLWEAGIPRVCIENPVGCLPRFIGPAAQWVHPHQFGHDASKKTGLWMRGLPNLVGTKNVAPRMINGRPRWANQTDSGQNRLGPSDDRWKLRAKTYQGIADAMAQQWGSL